MEGGERVTESEALEVGERMDDRSQTSQKRTA